MGIGVPSVFIKPHRWADEPVWVDWESGEIGFLVYLRLYIRVLLSL